MSRHCLPVLFALAAAALVFVTTARGQVRLGPRGPVIVRPEPKGSSKSRPRRPAIDRTKPTTFKLTVSPAAEPEPALKYALLPRFEDLKPGNSTPFYYRAILSIKDRPKDPLKPFHDNYDTWMNGPPSQMPRDEVRKFLRGFRNVFHELKIATHREKTDWAWRLKDVTGIQAIAFLLPEVQEARQVARLLILRIRLAIAERRYDDAIASFQMGYQLARDVAEPPTLINDLVGVSIAQMLTAELRNMSGTSGAPNMYWALSKMRRPFIDMEPAMRYEMTLPAKVFPALQDAETADHSPEEWGRILADAFLQLQGAEVGRVATGPQKRLQAQLAVTGLAMRSYPRIKRELLAWGYDEKRVEAMPVGQAVAIHQGRVYRHMSQELMKWSHLPYHVARRRMQESEAGLKRDGYIGKRGEGRELIPLTALLLPAVAPARAATARLDARIACLQTLEAIRMYAADHNGKLPPTLADIRKVPVPNNPLTGRPFPYHQSHIWSAVLELPAPPSQPANVGWRLEITIIK